MNTHVHAHTCDLGSFQHLRLFEPLATLAATARGVDSPELDAQLAVMIGFPKYAPEPRCLLCETLLGADPPVVMGWVDMPGGKAIFAVCGSCADAGTEQRIYDKIGFKPVEFAGNA